MKRWFLLLLVCRGTLGSLFTLSDRCPPSLTKGEDGQCHYQIRYLKEPSSTGLQKSFPLNVATLNPRVIDLGRYLFFDPVLSANSTVSCAHCHNPDLGFSDGRKRSQGILGSDVKRSAPSLWNVAALQTYFWDGRAATLEKQAEGPLFNHDEMGETRSHLLKKLNGNAHYRSLFAQAFGSPAITIPRVLKSIATFEKSLVSFNSRYDRYVFGEYSALTPKEISGLNVFRSFVTRCTECHTPPLFTNHQSAVIGAPDLPGEARDIGMESRFQSPPWRGAFRIPSLRNIALTAPYMHSGVFPSLREVIAFYNRGGGRASPSPELGYSGDYLHWHIRRMDLNEGEMEDLVAFLGSLTDESGKPERPSALPSGLSSVLHHGG